jgi:hypothetical protein
MTDLADRLDTFHRGGDLTDSEVNLLTDWAAGGPSCEAIVLGALSRAGWARDATGKRKALGQILARVRNTACFS